MRGSAWNGPISCMLLLNVCAQGVLKLNGEGNKQGGGRRPRYSHRALAFLGAVAGVFSGCLEGFVAKSKWGEAICFVLASAAEHVLTLVNVRLQQTSSSRREIWSWEFQLKVVKPLSFLKTEYWSCVPDKRTHLSGRNTSQVFVLSKKKLSQWRIRVFYFFISFFSLTWNWSFASSVSSSS